MHIEDKHTYYVYILTNRNKPMLYTGITNNLATRLTEHQENIPLGKKTFAARY
ncbi:GIY-YIG nuclease family protein [Flagellimonas ochracea]|uniref:GIY-YIG nuclease family protein n=1 Tax=Flagellimonas ochracea TaxID=2696472 RepID=UPI0028BDE7AF|nr:GIY-YIG nuclease family protein [Allomuricauda ochracea]